jgi:hypothetical protein
MPVPGSRVGSPAHSTDENACPPGIPAGTSLLMFFGALLAYVGYRLFPSWSKRFLLALAADLIAGESLFGVASSIWSRT